MGFVAVSIGSITDRLLSLPAALVLAICLRPPRARGFGVRRLHLSRRNGRNPRRRGGLAGRVPLWAVIAAAASGAIIGDSVGYFIGQRWGTHLLHGTIGRLPIIRRHLDKHLASAQAYVRRLRKMFLNFILSGRRVALPR
jgi:hypothetical protein